MNRSSPRFLFLCALAIFISSCTETETPPPGIQTPEGYQVTIFATGLNRPTQMILGPDGQVWMAQLAGNESDGTGEVLALTADKTSRVILDSLFKPTGLAWIGENLWIAAGRDILRAPLNEQFEAGMPEAVLSELAYNGRSNGTLTVTPDQQLIFETSGSRTGSVAKEGSAMLWQLDPADPTHPQVLATGLKNAYAHTFDATGNLWITDVADDQVNDGPPPDELNLIIPTLNTNPDFGWPKCFGAQKPARNYDGTDALCANTRPSVTVFDPHSTPTSIVLSPWEPDTLLVALWGPVNPSIVQIKIMMEGDNAVAQEVTPFLTGLKHPQHLLMLPDGSLLVSDNETGSIYQVTRR